MQSFCLRVDPSAINDRRHWDTNARTPIRDAVRELVDRLRFVLASQSLFVMRAINTHVTLDILTKILANLGENGFIAFITHGTV